MPNIAQDTLATHASNITNVAVGSIRDALVARHLPDISRDLNAALETLIFRSLLSHLLLPDWD